MTNDSTPERERTIAGLGLDIEDAIDTPAMVNGDAASVLDTQAAAILECAEALVH
jgi:hypothetical protein